MSRSTESRIGASAAVARVCIVGRPNVGKSTLFNRLAGRRIAITDATAGVTRDPVGVDAVIHGTAVRLLDTGGYTNDSDEMARIVSARAMGAVRECDVVVFVVDVGELTAADLEFGEALRPYRQKVIVAVNKVDNRERQALVYGFYELGFDAVVGVSATHGLNFEALREEIVTRISVRSDTSSAVSASDGESDRLSDAEPGIATAPEPVGESSSERVTGQQPIRIAILGQPNTGKSTLANALTGTEGSIVSEVPGTTRDVIRGTFSRAGRDYVLLDTAGIRRKSKVSEDLEYYSVTRAFGAIEDADVVYLLIDAEKGLTDQDKKIAAQVVKRGRGIIIVLNKWDLLKQIPNQLEAVRDRILFLFPILGFAPVLAVSARERTGLEELVSQTNGLFRELQKRVETGKLNSHLAGWMDENPPPTSRHGRWKVRYMTQVSAHPISFVLFVNRTHGFPGAYVGYIQNCIRRDFGLSRVPLDMVLRE